MADGYVHKEDASDAVIKHLQLDYEYAWGVREAINTLHSADVVPVVHGRWMPQKGGGLCCSECGGYALDEPDGNFIHVAVPSKFCPNCGAKMDAQREE